MQLKLVVSRRRSADSPGEVACLQESSPRRVDLPIGAWLTPHHGRGTAPPRLGVTVLFSLYTTILSGDLSSLLQTHTVELQEPTMEKPGRDGSSRNMLGPDPEFINGLQMRYVVTLA